MIALFVIDPTDGVYVKNGALSRYFLAAAILFKVIFSIYLEYYRLRYLKSILFDNHDTLKISMIARMKFLLLLIVPVISICWAYLGFRGTLFKVICGIMGFQESINVMFVCLKFYGSPSKIPIQEIYVERMYPSIEIVKSQIVY
jgi:hypothetical protein